MQKLFSLHSRFNTTTNVRNYILNKEAGEGDETSIYVSRIVYTA